MGKKVGEFFIELAVDAASGNLSVKQLIGALGELEVVSVGSVGIIGKIGETLFEMGKAATETAVQLTELRETAGVDPALVNSWEKAAQGIGIHSGSIIRSVQAINQMMIKLAMPGGRVPMELTSMLGINPMTGKFDAKGHPIPKDFFQIMADLANPKSSYWTKYNDRERQGILAGAFPGADTTAMFRILKEGQNFRPQNFAGLDDKKIGELTDISRKTGKIGQEMTAIFEKLITGGGKFAGVLDSISGKLIEFDKWLGTHSAAKTGVGLQAAGGAGMEIAKMFYNPLGFGMDALKFLDHELTGVKRELRAQDAVKFRGEALHGSLDINIMDGKGSLVEKKKALLDPSAPTTKVAVNVGNGGSRQ